MPELTRRYVVMTMAAAAPFDPTDREAPFVLKPWKDPAALMALKAYRRHCYPELARDLEAWIRLIEAGPSLRGDVGRRNEAHLAGGRPRGGRTTTRREGSKGRSGARAKSGARRARAPVRRARGSRRAKGR